MLKNQITSLLSKYCFVMLGLLLVQKVNFETLNVPIVCFFRDAKEYY